MNRNTYLAELRNCLSALPVEEQDEALEYYTDFFEDADDDEKVIAELGTPEKLAEEIKARFACVPARIEAESPADKAGGAAGGAGGKGGAGNGAGASGGNGQAGGFRPGKQFTSSHEDCSHAYRSSGLFYSFDPKAVRNLELTLGAAEIVMITGDRYSVETRGIEPVGFKCTLSDKGTLRIDNKNRLPSYSFWEHEDRHHAPRILITVPENADLQILKVSLAAGSFTTQKTAVSCRTGFFDLSAGNLVIENLHGGELDVHCGMGNMKLTGTAAGSTKVDCGMGKVALELTGNAEDYSFAGRVGLGEISFNGDKKSGVGSIDCAVRKENHFSVNCGMGQVTITMTR